MRLLHVCALLINTLLQRGVHGLRANANRFNGFAPVYTPPTGLRSETDPKPLKRLTAVRCAHNTPLKQGVNERRLALGIPKCAQEVNERNNLMGEEIKASILATSHRSAAFTPLHLRYAHSTPENQCQYRNSTVKRRKRRAPILPHALTLICGIFLLAAPPAGADELAEKGRQVFQKHQHSVVTVQIVVRSKVSFGGRGAEPNESRQDVTGTIIDPSGLTVVSLSATDPGQMIQNVMSSMSADDESKVKVETELSDVKLLLQDGTEVPAEVVLRDRDLDLAFLRPKTKLTTPLPAVDLADSGKAQLLDQVLALMRQGNAAGRAYSASAERISAIVERPRLFYVPETSYTVTPMGAPAFTLDGKILGVFVMRSIKATSGSGMSAAMNQRDNITGIILPAEAVLKAAKQVPAVGEGAKPAEEKK